VKQTGKAMPVQFNRYVARQVSAHVRWVRFRSSGRRILEPNPYVDAAKRWFCEEVGYANQEGACRACWMFGSCDLRRKVRGAVPFDPGIVGIGEEDLGRRRKR